MKTQKQIIESFNRKTRRASKKIRDLFKVKKVAFRRGK